MSSSGRASPAALPSSSPERTLTKYTRYCCDDPLKLGNTRLWPLDAGVI
jgi:hypothetical protein